MENEYLEKYLKLSCGNPGAITVIIEIYKNYPFEFMEIMDKMEKKEIVDYHIWVLYKEKNKDIDLFVKHILNSGYA